MGGALTPGYWGTYRLIGTVLCGIKSSRVVYESSLQTLHHNNKTSATACTSRRSTARPRVCGPARAGLQPAPAQRRLQAGVARRIG